MQAFGKTLKTIVRLAVTLGAVTLAFSQVDVNAMLPMLRQIPLSIILLVVVLIQFVQVIGGLRTRYFLRHHAIYMPVRPSVELQYLGELYSAVLPGGAGGDVYKVWWLKRHMKGRVVGMAKVMIGGRLNGLWALGVLVCVLLLCSAVPQMVPHGYLLTVLLLVAGTVGYSLFARYVLKEPYRLQLGGSVYSLTIQCTVGLAVWCLCLGLGIGAHAAEYVTLYQLACVLALLPISIGGIGVRELAVLHGSRLLMLDEERGVALALSVTLISLTVPLVGALIQLLGPKPGPGADMPGDAPQA